jgi:hypothetical protein
MLYRGQEYKPLDSIRDLNRADRAYLKEQGISTEQFDKMNPVEQNEWKEECKDLAYDNIRKLK